MRCASLVVPSARLVSTWVSPRVNRPGAVDARQHAGLALDRPDLVGVAAVGALLVDRDAAGG